MDNSTSMAGPRRQRQQRMASGESYHDEIPVPIPGQGSNKPSAISTHSLERYYTATPQKQRFSWLFIVIMGLSTIVTASLLAMRLFTLPASAAPQAIEVEVDVAAPAASVSTAAPAYPAPASPESAAPKAPAYSAAAAAAAGSWWMSDIKRQGVVAYGSADYKIFRNVKDYGAKGDGSSDDTEAINAAFSDGNRCGKGCDSSTTTPAIVYFPPGTYVVSKPILPYYYTHMIGDVNNLPVLKPTANFEGMAVIDVDPYNSDGSNWHTNQNNFFRQVRNFKIDLTGMPKSSGTGIHWQVAQATSLQNIVFQMIEDPSDDNKQQGIFIDNGSGGFMTDLTFIGGRYGGFFGSQQFTSRNMTFRNCNTAVYMNWNWLWTLNGLDISGAKVGIDMTAGGNVQNVGSILLTDSKIANTAVGVLTNYNPAQPDTNGTLIIDNVDMSSAVPVAVKGGGSSATILAGNAKIASWVQGRAYSGGSGKAIQATQTPVTKPKALLDSKGNVVTKSKPQYNSVPSSNFISVKSKGAKGDGKTDDTAAIQAVFNSVQDGQIVYFDHGAYVITDTVKVPKNIKIVGEVWPLIMAGGNKSFKDQAIPKPVWQVGQAGDVGNVEIQDLIFETLGPQPGAILMEFNVAGSTPGSAGLFDVHFRVGGSAGTQLQSDKCKKNPKVKADPNAECLGAFMLFHMTKQSSCYLENTWFWVADHELDLGDHSQINLYNGRGVLIESTKGAWLWGTASEHSVLYNYHLEDASNVYMSLIQTETAYMQGNPDATVPFTVNKKYFDPDFKATCTGTSQRCARTWGLRAVNSKDVFIYGGGLYSFFDNYDQVCVGENNCQDNMIDIESSQVHLYGISTKASVNMVNVDGKSAILDKDNRNNFCAAIALFSS